MKKFKEYLAEANRPGFKPNHPIMAAKIKDQKELETKWNKETCEQCGTKNSVHKKGDVCKICRNKNQDDWG